MNGIMNKRDPIIRLPSPIQDLQWVLQLCSQEDQEGLVDPQDLFHPFLLHFLQIPNKGKNTHLCMTTIEN